MPGGGKSSIGRLLSKRLGVDFFDLDLEIERVAGRSISAVFHADGEERFRELESDALRRLADRDRGVLATGGGAVLMAINRDLLRSRTLPIYLFARPPELWRRVQRNSRRPLLQVADPFARLTELFEQRHPLYCDIARFTIETGRLSMRQVAEEIANRVLRPASRGSGSDGRGDCEGGIES
jgi:shikimate kinase